MKLITRLILIVACFTAAFTIGTVTHAVPAAAASGTPWIGAQAATVMRTAARVTGTPAQDAAACAAVYHYHHMNAINYGGAHATATERAWYHAYHLARYADTDLRDAIRHYLNTGNGWSMVLYLCGYRL